MVKILIGKLHMRGTVLEVGQIFIYVAHIFERRNLIVFELNLKKPIDYDGLRHNPLLLFFLLNLPYYFQIKFSFLLFYSSSTSLLATFVCWQSITGLNRYLLVLLNYW